MKSPGKQGGGTRFTLANRDLSNLQLALDSTKHTDGYTHNFYLYPARFSPEIARAVITEFSNTGDWVLDPFMGGGTAIVEGVLLGRYMFGTDINALAHFVAGVRTRPLSHRDEQTLLSWAMNIAKNRDRPRTPETSTVKNLPLPVSTFLSAALTRANRLPFPRQQAFARCSLLRLGQWALDCREPAFQSTQDLSEKLSALLEQMIDGLHEFVHACKVNGIAKNRIVSRRILLNRNAIGIDLDDQLRTAGAKPQLVFTSPPYPRVHVLYHRWQVGGRKETPAPYWIAQVSDGYNASYYTGGSRSNAGERSYFDMIRSAFSSVRNVIADDGVVVQLVGFSDIKTQLPRYLETMSEAGFDAQRVPVGTGIPLWRSVPNRRWYTKLQGGENSASELLLFHRPRFS